MPRELLVIGALVLGGTVLAAAGPSESSFANIHPEFSISNSKPSLLVRDSPVSGLPVHAQSSQHASTDGLTGAERTDLQTLRESRAPTYPAFSAEHVVGVACTQLHHMSWLRELSPISLDDARDNKRF